MDYSTNRLMSKKVFYEIIRYYLELHKNNKQESAPQIAASLELGITSVRNFLKIIDEFDDDSKIYEIVMLHTKFAKSSCRYSTQQKMIKELQERKNIKQQEKIKQRKMSNSEFVNAMIEKRGLNK